MSDPFIDHVLSTVDWQLIEWATVPDELHATHSGSFMIGDFEMKCFQLSNGQRILDADCVHEFFGGEVK